jgi:hypothetical protein
MKEKHDLRVNKVLKRLPEIDLVISPEKCLLSSERVEYLSYVLIRDGMETAIDKIGAIKEWLAPRSLRDV